MFILHMKFSWQSHASISSRLCSNMLSIEITDPTNQDPAVFMLKALCCIAVASKVYPLLCMNIHCITVPVSHIISALLESSVFIIMAHPCAHSYIFIIQREKVGTLYGSDLCFLCDQRTSVLPVLCILRFIQKKCSFFIYTCT